MFSRQGFRRQNICGSASSAGRPVELTAELLGIFEQAFYSADLDGDGEISRMELGLMFHQLGVNMKGAQLDKVFEMVRRLEYQTLTHRIAKNGSNS